MRKPNQLLTPDQIASLVHFNRQTRMCCDMKIKQLLIFETQNLLKKNLS